MVAYSYSRTSEIEQLDRSQSKEECKIAQEASLLKEYSLDRGIDIAHTYVDNSVKWSVDFMDRQQGISLLNTLESGDSIITFSIERMFSSCEDLHRVQSILTKMQVKLIILELDADITCPSCSPSFTTMLTIFQGLEKRRSTERIRLVKRNQRDKGRFLGGSRPFGYMIHSNGRLIENPIEQKVVKQVLKMKEQGKSLRAISLEVSTPIVPISYKTVQRLIKRHEAEATASVQ